MNHKKKFLAAVSLIAISSSVNVGDAKAIKQEKCFGISKAGKNDCKASDGSHACASYSKVDGTPVDWLMLPEGVCERIVGASVTPPETEE